MRCCFCISKKSVRDEICFNSSKLDYITNFKRFKKCINADELEDIINDYVIDRKSFAKYNYIMLEIIFYYENININYIGGLINDESSKIFEIDESLFFKENSIDVEIDKNISM